MNKRMIIMTTILAAGLSLFGGAKSSEATQSVIKSTYGSDVNVGSGCLRSDWEGSDSRCTEVKASNSEFYSDKDEAERGSSVKGFSAPSRSTTVN